MQKIRRNGRWVAVAMCAAILASGVFVANQHLMAQKNEGRQTAKITDPRDLTRVFRDISHEALPSIVSIETVGKTVKTGANDAEKFGDLFGENSPFGEMFKQNPRFKEFKNMRPQQMPRSHGMGSGFVIDASGIILTNNHVVADADEVKVKLQDGSEYIATEIKTDPRTDVAIVRIKPEGKLKALAIGDSDAMEVGDWVLAVGSPFGLDFSVTQGIISAKGRGPRITEREDFLQTDAAINPGNSGGPLLNLNGEVIGINTAISSRSGGNDGVGFAIPINLASWVSHQLIATGSVSRAYLGVQIQPITSALAKQFNLQAGQGALVSQVMPNSPAAEADLQSGDVIQTLDGKKVSDPRTLQGVVEQLKIGQKYPMKVLRDGKELTLHVTGKEMPKDFSLASASSEIQKPGKPNTDTFEELGLDAQPLTPELAEQLGYQKEAAHGVVISSVKEDGPAARAHLQAGWIIEKVGNQKVGSPAELKEALKKVSLEKGILMYVRSPQSAEYVVVK